MTSAEKKKQRGYDRLVTPHTILGIVFYLRSLDSIIFKMSSSNNSPCAYELRNNEPKFSKSP